MGKKRRKPKGGGFNPGSGAARGREENREALASAPKKGGGRATFVGIAVAAAVVAIAGFIIFGGGEGSFKAVTAEAGVVKIPVAEVSDGVAHRYTYDSRGKQINFFVLKGSDGVIRAAFDACDICFGEKKGYRQEGDLMVCNNCGQQFPSVRVNVMREGCNPAPLMKTLDGQYLVLRAADIESGSMYF